MIADNNAVALHSRIPSLQLPLLIHLLSDRGIYFSSTFSTNMSQRQDEVSEANAELRRSWKILQKETNMELVENVEGGNHTLIGNRLTQVIFRKPHGPKINAFIT